MDLSILLPNLKTTSAVALACTNFSQQVKSNGFPIKTSKEELCLKNWQFYKSLGYLDADYWMYTQVILTILKNDVCRLSLLLEHGADPEARGNFGRTAVIMAARWGATNCLKLLLQYKADVEARDDRERTALIEAASFNSTDCIKLLLAHGAKVSNRTRKLYSKYFR